MNLQEIKDIDFSPLSGPLSKNDMTKIKYISRYQLLNKLPQPTLKFIAQHYLKLGWVSLAGGLLAIINTNVIIRYIMTALPARYPAHVKPDAFDIDIQKTIDYLNNRQNAEFIMNFFGNNSSLIDIYAENNRIILQWSSNDDYQQIAQTIIQLVNYLQ